MQIALLLVFGLPISVSDFCRHIIPNRALLVFAGSICVQILIKQNLVEHLVFALKVLIFLAIFQWITAGVMGMGDAKYLLLLALLIGSGPLYLRGLLFSALVAVVTSLVYFIYGRSLNIDIPLAPSFTLGFALGLAL